jgi:hypothetical protein
MSDKWMAAVGVAMALRDYLPLLSDQERRDLFILVANGYCDHCGGVLPERGCLCTFDDRMVCGDEEGS